MLSPSHTSRFFKIFLPLLLMLALAACPSMEEKRDKFMAQGKEAFEKGEFINARLYFKNALQLDPKLAEGHLWLGKTELRLQNPRGAFGAISKAVELNPDLLEGQLLMGNFLLAMKKPEEAEAKARLVLAKDPRHSDARLLLAGVALAREQPQEALKIFEEIRRQHPGKLEAYLLPAEILAQKKQFQQAATILDEGLKANPQGLPLYLTRARLAEMQKQFELAGVYLDKAQGVAPKEVRVQDEIARLHILQQQWDKAEAALRKKTELEPDKEAHVAALARFLAERGRWEEGEKLLQQFVAAHPKNQEARFALANFYLAGRRTGKGSAILREIAAAESNSPIGLKAKTQLAVISLGQGRRDEAEKLVKEVLKENPKDMVALKLEGLIALTKPDGLKAVSNFRILTQDQPQNPENWLLLARAHLANKEETLGREAAKKALDLKPDYREAKEVLYGLYFQKKDYDGLIKLIREYLRANERDLLNWGFLGDAYVLKGDTREAEAAFQKMVTLEPKNPGGYIKLALLARKNQQLPAALQHLERAMKENPQAYPALRLWVRILLEEKQPAKALEVVRAAAAKSPKNDEIQQILGEVLLATQQPQAAAAALEESLTLNPNDPQALVLLVRAYEGMWGQEAARQKLADKAADPKALPFFALALAQVYERQQQADKAIELYEKLLARQVVPPLVKNNLAYLLAEHRPTPENLTRARELMGAVLEDNPEDPHLLDTMGWILCKQNEFAQARDFLERAVARNREHPVLQYHLGFCLAKLGEKQAAREALIKALATKTEFPGKAEAQKLLESLPKP